MNPIFVLEQPMTYLLWDDKVYRKEFYLYSMGERRTCYLPWTSQILPLDKKILIYD